MVPKKIRTRPQSRNTEPLNFRVSREFKKRFKLRALNADLKLYELLSEALAAWEEKHGLKGGK